MNKNYYYDEYGEGIQNEVFNIIKSLSNFNETSKTKLSDTPEANGLFERMRNISIHMLFIKKIRSEDFTIFKDNQIQQLKIDEEIESFNEKDTLSLYKKFKDEKYFHELVAKCFIDDSNLDQPLHNHIFYIHSLSKFCNNQVELYTYFNCKKRKMFVRYMGSEITLDNYIDSYLGLGFTEKIKLKKEIYLLCEKENDHTSVQKKLNEIFYRYSNGIKLNHDFLQGSICFFDFLGWKGLWQNSSTKPLTVVTNLIENITQKMNSLTKEAFPTIPICSEMSRLISISDTIAIFTPEVKGTSKIQLLELHAQIAKYILEESCKAGYPIRGAIAYGEYSIMNNIMIGPGIDECASWHETCNWIGAHFTPSAQFILDSVNTYNDSIITKYNIPLKSNLAKLKYCVKWNITDKDFDNVKSKVKAILPEIAAKYINTHDFLTLSRKENNDANRED